MKQVLIITILFIVHFNAALADEWTMEQKEIIARNEAVPLVLKEKGFTAYAKMFHPDYTNWYMPGDKDSVRSRENYLDSVKDWFENGNYAIYSKVTPISVEIVGDIAYEQHVQEEHFIDANGNKTKFIGHFSSLMKKYEGKWTFYRTSFQERYRGPLVIGSEKKN